MLQKRESHLFPLAIEILGGISANLKKTLKLLAVLSDNRSFHAQGLSVGFCTLMQSLSITAIWGSAAMLLARAPFLTIFLFGCSTDRRGDG